MIYGYIRVSTDKQTVENQRFEIMHFCDSENLRVDGWIEETVSGTFSYRKRRLGRLLRNVKPGDVIISSELSRLGRSLFMVMEILSFCLQRGCRVWTVKDGYRLGDDIQSKVLAFAFALSAEIERNLISMRTREALARLRLEGVSLGRPKGRTTSHEAHPLFRHDAYICRALTEGRSMLDISRSLHCNRDTLSRYIRKYHPDLYLHLEHPPA